MGGNWRFLTGGSQEALRSRGGPALMGPGGIRVRPEEGVRAGSAAKPPAEGPVRQGRPRQAAREGHGGRSRGKKRQRVTVGHIPTTEEGSGWELVLELSCPGSSPSSASAALWPRQSRSRRELGFPQP